MTIQLSVSVWTVICFVLLMLILHNLLFKPVLRVMDERHERIKKAAEKKAEHEKTMREYESVLTEKRIALHDEQKRIIKDELELIRAKSKEEIETAKDERLREVDDYRLKAEADHNEILNVLSVHTTELANAFADSLIKE